MSRAESWVVACDGHGATRLERRTLPPPGDGEVLLRLHCCGLCGTDLHKLRHGPAPSGTVLGHELVGTVEESGPGAGAAEGERLVVPHHVACGACAYCHSGSETLCPRFREELLEPGGFSERILVRRRAVELAARVVPSGLADEAALFMEPAACVLRGIRRSGLLDRETAEHDRSAAILGAGSMGLLHLLLLRALAPRIRLLVSDPLSERRELALRLGAEEAAEPDRAALEAAAESLSAGRGVDAVFDTVGGAGPLETAVGLGRPGGTVVLFAHARPGDRAGFELNSFFKQERRLVATYSGSLAEQEEAFGLLVAGRFDPTPLVTHRFPLADFERAVETVESRRGLKVLLTAEPS